MVSRSCGHGAVRPSVVGCTASSTVTESSLPELVCEPRTNLSSAPQNHPEGADSPASPPTEEHQQMPPQMPRLIPLYRQSGNLSRMTVHLQKTPLFLQSFLLILALTST